MKKKIIIALVATVLVILIAAAFFWFAMTRPLYQPGMVREGKNLRAPLTPPTQTGDPDYWQVEPGIQLYHFSQGEGRNVLIVHGGPGRPFRQSLSGLEPLTGGYQFHYYDQRGCGQSTRPFDRFESQNMYENMTVLDQTLGLGAQIADIERIRQILGEDRLILIGHSWGGFLASLYAAEFPERVEALVLVSPANTLVMPQPEAESDLFASVRARLPEEKRAEYDAFMKDYFDFNKLFTRSDAELVAMDEKFGEYYLSVVDIQADEAVEQGEAGGWMTWGMYVSMGQRHDYRAALRPVTAPVLVIHGADDLQSEAASYLYAEQFPNAQFAVIQDAGHFSFEEQPEAFARLVGDFLTLLK
ncbi:MAG: alpha/beta fold hydrolase [Chloroflexota bacterium]